MGFESAFRRGVPHRLAVEAGINMRRLADATRELVRSHARDHAKRSGRRSCRRCRAAAVALIPVESHIAGDYFA